jgi:hypothetical protein
MWYEDLTGCDYFADILPAKPISIGWLENGKLYTKGKTPGEIVEKIIEFNKNPGMYHRFCGYHECDFCDFFNIELGATTILIAYKNKAYICPALIIHYIEEHFYLPPDEFIEAVLNYDHHYAMEYFKKIRENRIPKIK